MHYFAEANSDFVKILTDNPNSLEISNKAISLIAHDSAISRIAVEYDITDALYTHRSEHTRIILFDKDYKGPNAITNIKAYKEKNPETFEKNRSGTEYKKVYRTGNNGEATFFVYHDTELPEWNEEDLKYIDATVNLLILCYARAHLIDVLENMILFDPMSGIPSTEGFFKFARTMLTKGELNQYNSYYCNLKRFRVVNRKFGKKETDRMLIEYCRKINSFANENECIGRLGGDNFVALIKKERTEEFLEFIQGVEICGEINGIETPAIIRAVAGCYEITTNTPDEISYLIDKCGIAMNIAKHVAKKPYLFYTAELNDMMINRHKTISYFPDALANKEFLVYYQPKVDTFTQEIKGAEGLARWKRGEKIYSPGIFIPVLEEDGSICQLDFYMLERVCEDIRRWLDLGIEPVRISVNFSRMNLTDPRFAEKILEIIEKYSIPKNLIEIEITETLDEAEKGLLQKFMNKLNDEGILTAIDDFGTGYSSINLLREFPVDVLKLDKSFVDSHIDRPKDYIVLDNIVKMATDLNIEVVMEGVETKEQLDFMREIKCHYIQGYIFDKPMPEPEFREKMIKGSYNIEF